MGGAARSSPHAALAAFIQPVAMGVLLGQGWHVYSKVMAHGSLVGIGLCSAGVIIGMIAGIVVSRAAPPPNQAALRLSLFWISCTVNGGLSAIAQLRLRVGRSQANDDALIVNSFLSSGLLGTSLPHVVMKVAKRPEAEVVMPCILAVLLTEAICSSETMPGLQVAVATFLLAVGIQGIANDSNSDISNSKSGASGGSDSSRSAGAAPAHEPFFPATVMASRRYSPHFLVGRRMHCVPNDLSGVVPLVSLVPRQAATEAPRAGGKGKDRGQRSSRQRSMEDLALNATNVPLAASPHLPASLVPPVTPPEPVAVPVEMPSRTETKEALQQNANVGSDIRWDVVYEEMKRVDNGKITKVAGISPSLDGPAEVPGMSPSLDGPVEVFAQLAEGDADVDEGWPCDVDVTHVPLGDSDLGDDALVDSDVFACDKDTRQNGHSRDEVSHKHTEETSKPDSSTCHQEAMTTAPRDRGNKATDKAAPWARPQHRAPPVSHEWQPPPPLQQQQQQQQQEERDLVQGDAVAADDASDRGPHSTNFGKVAAEAWTDTSCQEPPLHECGPTLADDTVGSLQDVQSAGTASLRAGAEAFIPVDSVPAEAKLAEAATVETPEAEAVPESASSTGTDPSMRPKLRADAQAFFPTPGLLTKSFHSSVPAASQDTTITADPSTTEGTAVDENGAPQAPARMEFFAEADANGHSSGNAADAAATSVDHCPGQHEYHWGSGSMHRMEDDWSAPFGPDTAHVVTVGDDKKPFGNGGYGYNGHTWDSYAHYAARHAWDSYGSYGDDGTGLVQPGYGYGADGTDYDAGTWPGAGHNGDQAQLEQDATQATDADNSDALKKDNEEPIASLIDPELPDPGPGRASDIRRTDVFDPSVGSSKPFLGGDSNARTLWVGDLETWMAESYISDLFADMALVTNVSVTRERGGRQAFVEFASHNAALGVLESLGGQPISAKDGRKLPVSWAQQAKDGRKPPANWAGQQQAEDAQPIHQDSRVDVQVDRKRQDRERASQRVTERYTHASASEVEMHGRYSRGGRQYGGTSGDSSGAGISWAYVDPNGQVQVGFTMEEMREWFQAGYFEGDMKLALVRGNHAQGKTPPAREFYPLKQWFPDVARSFTYVPRF